MQVSVEKLSNIERRLTITVPANQLEEVYQSKINQIAKKANIKGFRPGKAPRSFIEKQYGNDARQEALSTVIQNSLYKALVENKLNPVSTPQVAPKSLLADQPLEFTASFEVLPEIENVRCVIEKIEKLNVEVTAADVDEVIEQLSKQFTQWKLVERAAKLHDRVVIDYCPIIDGKADEASKSQNFPVELGNKAMLPGFEAGLQEAKAGEERNIKVDFPADFANPDFANKSIDFIVNIKQVFEAEKPIIDEDFVKKLGVASGKHDDLQAQVRRSIEMERDRLVSENLKEQVFRNLLEQNQLDIPQALIEREAKNIHNEMYPPHQHHDHHQHSTEEMSAFNDIARKRVALGLLIAEYAKQVKLVLDTERVEKRILEIASAYEQPKEVVEWLSSKERLAGIEAQVMEDQVLDKLIEGLAVTEIVKTYAELKANTKT